jgi:excinuclease UvrABC nuclease subunit
MLALDCGQEFDPARDEEFFAALPAHPAVFLLEPRAANAQPYLARTADLRRAAERLLRAPELPSKRLNLRELAARIRYRLTGSKLEQALVLYQQARELFPRRYRDLLRLRTPPLLKVNLRNEYPRCYVTRRILADSGSYFGPFPSRKAAESLANDFLDLFKIRRCQIKIRRDPTFPGCVYSEMKMCLAPCFAGCTKEEYDVEVGRVLETLATAGAALENELSREREASSEALDFERAATLHKKLEKVSSVLRGLPEVARRVDELNAVILQLSAEENAIAVFVVRSGMIADPFLLRFGELSSQPRSVEEILRDKLEASAGAGSSDPAAQGGSEAEIYRAQFGLAASPEPLGEHLAILARWYYSKPRQGEIFFRSRDWPYRRIIRACSRLLNPQPSLPFPAKSQEGQPPA